MQGFFIFLFLFLGIYFSIKILQARVRFNYVRKVAARSSTQEEALAIRNKISKGEYGDRGCCGA